MILAAAAVVALSVAAVATATTVGNDGNGAEVAGVRIAADGSTVRGVAHFEQEGDQVTGFVVVWGLEPNSAHAVHFHGPKGRCGTKADPVAVHPDLTADGNGVAYTNVAIAAKTQLLGGGYYYNVHAGPSRDAANPEIACGDIQPSD
ncbi:MAG: superoxide dismutase family protein [Actinomycetota bacterium]|nr:superoxide dismutase family protein [Actinomycetota bacterium]